VFPSFVSAKPAAWKLRSLRLRGEASCPMLAFNGFGQVETCRNAVGMQNVLNNSQGDKHLPRPHLPSSVG